jgi:hypothetical protein
VSKAGASAEILSKAKDLSGYSAPDVAGSARVRLGQLSCAIVCNAPGTRLTRFYTVLLLQVNSGTTKLDTRQFDEENQSYARIHGYGHYGCITHVCGGT